MMDITDFFALTVGGIGLLLSFYPLYLYALRGGVPIAPAMKVLIPLVEKNRQRARALCQKGERTYLLGTMGRMLDASEGLHGSEAAERANDAFQTAFGEVRSRQRAQLWLAVAAMIFLLLALLSLIGSAVDSKFLPHKIMIILIGLPLSIGTARNVRTVRRKLPLAAEQLTAKLEEL